MTITTTTQVAATDLPRGAARATTVGVRAPAVVVTRCACGLTYSEPAWRALPWCGDQPDGEIALEMRNC